MAKKEKEERSATARANDGFVMSDNPKPESEAKPEAGYKVNGREGAADSKPTGGTVAIKLAEDGSADPGTRPATWDKLKTMLDKTPEAKTRLFGKAVVAGLIQPKQIEPFYSGIGMVNVFLAIKLMKLNPEVAGAIIPYTQPELDSMSQATADAVNENLDKCPGWLLDLLRGGGSVAFAKLALVLFQVHAQKLQAVRNAMKPELEHLKDELEKRRMQ